MGELIGELGDVVDRPLPVQESLGLFRKIAFLLTLAEC